ncbi:thioredoxin family protein [Leptospira levettii]|uniref:Thioredoxin family protein n=1 Tax=Leptospira levettii TaxID=2023178 RepID=A0ABY2MKW0_9LEPT|nr:thioredoxin family protein [Leptospira levettii]PKA24553.1 thiol-disulfide isomerase [Leptospira sp. mixed culture ATI2-C-A1]TGK98971.1 thioredoxin family protein [Leptospira levettii]TGL09073.1 thioredoxin family protein [Leptospira levettii]TGL23736.1 thioredoxin family protein [Leptospira levettii]TGL67786.1 thioredoxin family protein [Leptospira levettii]
MEHRFQTIFSLLFFSTTLLLPTHCSKQRDIILTQYESSLAKAKSENRKLIIVFGADWCPDCRALDGIFADPETKTLLDSEFVVMKVDVGRFDKNLSLNDQLGNPIQNGIPSLVVVSPKGEFITSTKGGEFSNASKMTKEQVLAYLYKL